MDRISDIDEYFMRMVYLVAQRSSDPRTKIGSVLVRDKYVISTGYNQMPRGVNDLDERYNNRELKNKMIAHSEFNAIIQAARNGISTLNSTLYSQGIVCSNCCKAIINGGVRELVVHSFWPNLIHSKEWVESINLSKLMLNEAEIKIRTFDKELGIKGFLDGKEILV